MAVQKTKIDNWIFSQVALMLAKLEGSKEGDGTALDNTVVVTANDMEDGASHYVGKVPFVLIGSCGGFFKTGQFQKYSKVGHNRLLVLVAQRHGRAGRVVRCRRLRRRPDRAARLAPSEKERSKNRVTERGADRGEGVGTSPTLFRSHAMRLRWRGEGAGRPARRTERRSPLSQHKFVSQVRLG